MKTLKKISLKDVKVLDSDEMKNVLGHGTGCEGLTKSKCSGSCTVDGGHPGKCGEERSGWIRDTRMGQDLYLHIH